MITNSSLRSQAVRLVHEPTGLTTICSEFRSQHKNKESAWKRLCSLLYAQEQGIERSKEVIRTYTLPEDDPWPEDLMKYGREVKRNEDGTFSIERKPDEL